MANLPKLRPKFRSINELGGSPASDAVQQIYRRFMAGWASDLLARKPGPAWPATDSQADFRDRNWRDLYVGSVLDD